MHNPIDTYRQEAEELLSEIEQTALALGEGGPDPESVHRLFRAFHTIKGSGGMFGFTAVVAFTHHMESLLDAVRAGKVGVSKELIDLVLDARDRIQSLLGGGPEAQADEAANVLIERMKRLLPEGETPVLEKPAPVQVAAGTLREWDVIFKPDPAILAYGGSPLLLLRELAELGRCRISAHTENVPSLERLEPDVCYLWWNIRLRTDRGGNAIRDIFIFVEDGSELSIEPVLEADSGSAEAAPKLVRGKAPAQGQTKAAHQDSSVRVPADRLDRLVGLVGELVMNQSRLAGAASHSGCAELAAPVEEIERLVAELRDNVLGIRMMPIASIFGRFRRLVHDLSAELGKEVDLIVEGEETELDKSVLDQLGEPLVHLVRNSVDHGIEPAAEREAGGKPRRGAIRLTAEHAGSDVVVSVVDDGRGLDAAALRAKATENKLIAPDAVLSDKEIFNLIFLPGFSTARQVTNVSGRGVGMDVVKRQIDGLHGSVSISSELRKGTRISLKLPLTLAIIEGLVVAVGGQDLILPMTAVMENVELERAQRERNNARNVVAVRGELVPYVDLRESFQLRGERPAIEKIVIVHVEGGRVGLVVDRVLGTHQTVIQPLGKFLRDMDVVSGCTVMGDGRVALILDIPGVVRFAESLARQAAA
jgi:two-component system chemotaxis sensor kinase CheA